MVTERPSVSLNGCAFIQDDDDEVQSNVVSNKEDVEEVSEKVEDSDEDEDEDDDSDHEPEPEPVPKKKKVVRRKKSE